LVTEAVGCEELAYGLTAALLWLRDEPAKHAMQARPFTPSQQANNKHITLHYKKICDTPNTKMSYGEIHRSFKMHC